MVDVRQSKKVVTVMIKTFRFLNAEEGRRGNSGLFWANEE